jgi:hypothetical protein
MLRDGLDDAFSGNYPIASGRSSREAKGKTKHQQLILMGLLQRGELS